MVLRKHQEKITFSVWLKNEAQFGLAENKCSNKMLRKSNTLKRYHRGYYYYIFEFIFIILHVGNCINNNICRRKEHNII